MVGVLDATSSVLGTSGTGQFTCLTGLIARAPLTSQFLIGAHGARAAAASHRDGGVLSLVGLGAL